MESEYHDMFASNKSPTEGLEEPPLRISSCLFKISTKVELALNLATFDGPGRTKSNKVAAIFDFFLIIALNTMLNSASPVASYWKSSSRVAESICRTRFRCGG